MSSSLCKERTSSSAVSSSASSDSYVGAAWTNLDYAYDFLAFINGNPSEFHAAQYVSDVLEAHGFHYLSDRASWTDDPAFIAVTAPGVGGKFYTTRNGSSLVAFVVGPDWVPSGGIGLVGAHIDAVTAKLKPISLVSTSDENGAYIRLGVAPYGGGLSPVWLDRDLGLAGRIIVKENGKVASKLVNLDRPIGRIPTLAPHFGEVSRQAYNLETQMVPLIGLESSYAADYDKTPTEDEARSPVIKNHDIRLLRAVATSAGVALGDILRVELQLYNFQPGQLGGLDREFIFAPRIDDKLCVYSSLHGLLASAASPDAAAANHDKVSAVAYYDDEEVGSLTRQGARGTLFQTVIERLAAHYPGATDESVRATYANSFFVSADTTHAVNPNFADVYLEHHKPKLNTGITIKFNVNMANTTDAVSASHIEEVCRRTGNKFQYFHIRNDSRSGGTIGPALSAATGIKSLDVGIPQLAMHSIRATTGSQDPGLGAKFFKAFFEKWAEVDEFYKTGDL